LSTSGTSPAIAAIISAGLGTATSDSFPASVGFPLATSSDFCAANVAAAFSGSLGNSSTGAGSGFASAFTSAVGASATFVPSKISVGNSGRFSANRFR